MNLYLSNSSGFIKLIKDLNKKINVAGTNINYYRLPKEWYAQKLSDKLMIEGLDIHRQAIFSIEAGKRSVSDYELCIIAEV